jgi:hypothetical protein
MKKIILLSLILFCKLSFPGLKANPVVYYPPQAFLSEVFITSNTNWVIELEMFIPEMFLTGNNIDSIVIQSNSGRSKILSFPVARHAIFTINNSLLVNSLMIDNIHDTIRVLTYINPDLCSNYYLDPMYYHQLVFGYENCEIPILTTGQSICAREKQYGDPLYFYLDNSPTIGMENDTIDATATIHGRFYDCRDSLITYALNNFSFALYPNVESRSFPDYPFFLYYPLSQFAFDNQGFYTTHVLSRNFTVNNVGDLGCADCYYGTHYITILHSLPFAYNLEPGQTLEQDIHLTDSTFFVGYSKSPSPSDADLTIVCAPNPVITFTRIFITSENSLKNLELKIFDIQGEILKTFLLPDEKKTSIGFSKEELGGAGTYVYTVFEKNRRMKSGYIICE